MFEKKETGAAQETWKVTKAAPKSEKSGWRDAWRRRREPSAYQRCLAVHIHFASPRGGLS
jgi:hypothetical protein